MLPLILSDAKHGLRTLVEDVARQQAVRLGVVVELNAFGEMQQLVARRLDYPDDIMFGDAEAVIVILRKWADEIADEAAAMDEEEEFLKIEIESGTPTSGDYPPNAKTLARYQEWRKRDLA